MVALGAITAGAVVALVWATMPNESADALPPPAGAFSHGASGSARNGTGGSIGPSATSASWPGTGAAQNGGPVAFVGAHYGSLWGVPTGPNNSSGVGYCVMEDVGGEGTVAARDDPAAWDAEEMARAAALMATFGGDAVVPYGIDETGTYDTATGEWEHPLLFGGGEYTRRRHVAVNFAVRMFLEDQSPTGVAAGRKLARDTAVVGGSGGNFSALSNGYRVARHLADVADIQHATGGVGLQMVWSTPDGTTPTAPGSYPLEVRVTDTTGRPVGMVPVLQLSGVGIGADRSIHAIARVDNAGDGAGDTARWNAAAAAGWPVWQMNAQLVADPRFEIDERSDAADVASADGVARFVVEITDTTWELAFHAQAPTSDVVLYSGSGVQGQVTWTGAPHSASIGQTFAPLPPTTTVVPPPIVPPATAPPSTAPPSTAASTTAPPATSTVPPPTVPPATTTTAVPPPATEVTTTSTTNTTTTTTPASTTTTTTAPPTMETTAVPTTAPAASLPRTGGESRRMMAMGAWIWLLGAALYAVTAPRARRGS